MFWSKKTRPSDGDFVADKNSDEKDLIQRIREGESHAWEQLIDRYEGRLLAYVQHRLTDRSHAEDIVQETLIGFLNSLPHFDGQRSLENYLYTICSYKLTDHLRKQGRRSVRSLDAISSAQSRTASRLPGNFRVASSLARSVEQRTDEEQAIVVVLQEQIGKWQSQQDWQKLMCLELVIVAGRANRDVATLLGISEQKVANYKSDFIARTKTQLARIRNLPSIVAEFNETT
jgi:RNA polymerase sigma-70 factor, ECF subfamily